MTALIDPKWLGRIWVEDDYECADFAREILAERFGIAAPWGRPERGIRAKDAQFLGVVSGGGVRRVAGQPRLGDLVLMRAHEARRLAGWHVGIWFGAGVLHLPADGVSMFEPTERLARSWSIEGYFRCA